MKQIAVICALPPERNTGMVTVDLSAHVTLRALAPDAVVTFYTLGKLGPYAYAPAELPFRYHDIHDHMAEFLEADAWIYWGDFVHAHSYWSYDRGSWDAQATDESLKAQQRMAHDFIFLKSLSDAQLGNAIVFGSTIITNDASVVQDAEYVALSQRLFVHAKAVYFRDALSAAFVSPLRQDEATLACDCALLLEDEDLKLLGDVKFPVERRHIGVFFGRSRSKIAMLLYARMVGKKLGLSCTWLPWFSTRRRLRLIARLFGFRVAAGPTGNGEIFSQLAGHELIISDTYHLCVNAWRMGIPAICIGEGNSTSNHSLNDKKKEIFYEMVGARQFYVFSESLGNWGMFVKSVAQVAGAFRDAALTGEIRRSLNAQRAMGRRRLGRALREVLAMGPGMP